jgi:hypothetical protein
MFKKYAMKVSNSLSTINYVHRPAKGVNDDDDDGSRCSSYDSNYDQRELNRNLFIENYLIGRGVHKARSSSLSYVDDTASKDVSLKRNNRRKSLMEKRDERLKINRNHLYTEKSADNKCKQNNYYDIDEEKSLSYDFIETAAPTLKKISNIYQEFIDFELSI